MTDVAVLGVRHHGPGSARAVGAALAELQPDLVLIEGAPELGAVASLAASPHMVPPVAGLVYAPNQPARATFYPLATFSPEWVALRWALSSGVEVRFADLAAAHQLADRGGDEEDNADADAGGEPELDDPIAALARAAGFDDPERWWEDAVEHRHHGLSAFAAVCDAMAVLREGELGGRGGLTNLRREAAMRRAVRAAIAEGRRSVAFVCGAWHAPVLRPDVFPPVRADDALLKGRPKIKVTATWVPWTNPRLAVASGYGAGVVSPGWYEHLYKAPGDVSTRWLTRTAALLRDEGLDTSSASVIDAVRLADALATMRGRPLAGLAELTEATRSVLCEGSELPLRLVAERLMVGDALGSVPPETPMVPLARDLERAQKRLRLKPTASEQLVTLDLRKPSHLERSHLLHRLGLLEVPWGDQVDPGGTRGTFKEAWRLVWRPELSVTLIDASGLGTTIEEAATTVVRQRAADAELAALVGLVEDSLLADLPPALEAVMAALGERSARQHDTRRLMTAVEPLARVTRYGNVRQVDTEALAHLLHDIVVRACIGLAAACSSLDDDAAAEMRGLLDGVQRGLALANDVELRGRWLDTLAGVADQHGVHGVLVGRAVRLLLDAGRVDRDEVGRRMSLALSRGADARAGAAWLEGFLSGDPMLLLHDEALLAIVDGWVDEVSAELFDDLLPLLRRTFSEFSGPERRMIGERIVRARAGAGRPPAADDSIDQERANRVVPLLRQILGLDDE